MTGHEKKIDLKMYKNYGKDCFIVRAVPGNEFAFIHAGVCIVIEGKVHPWQCVLTVLRTAECTVCRMTIFIL